MPVGRPAAQGVSSFLGFERVLQFMPLFRLFWGFRRVFALEFKAVAGLCCFSRRGLTVVKIYGFGD